MVARLTPSSLAMAETDPGHCGPVRVCGCGRGQAALGFRCSVWFRSGAAAEGDFEAEVAELADVVGDLAAGAGLPLVVVRAEVLIPGAGAGEQLVVDLQLGAAEGDLGFGFAAAAGQPPVPGPWKMPGLCSVVPEFRTSRVLCAGTSRSRPPG